MFAVTPKKYQCLLKRELFSWRMLKYTPEVKISIKMLENTYYGGSFGPQNHSEVKVFSHTDKGSLIDENNRLEVKQVVTINRRVVETMVSVNMSSNEINPERKRLQRSNFQFEYYK